MEGKYNDPRLATHISNLSPKKLGKTGVDLDNEIQELRANLSDLGTSTVALIGALASRVSALESAAATPAIVATGGKK